jgi:acetylornithine/N-succinyldiaminopimelate aminotransferase
MTAIGLAVLTEVSKPIFLAHVEQMGQYLSEQLTKRLDPAQVLEQRGMGLLRAISFKHEKAGEFVKAARNLTPTPLLINSPRPNTLRFMPALNLTQDDIDLMLDLLIQAINKS